MITRKPKTKESESLQNATLASASTLAEENADAVDYAAVCRYVFENTRERKIKLYIGRAMGLDMDALFTDKEEQKDEANAN